MLEYVQKTMVDPRNDSIREKDRQIMNQQKEIRYLKRINEQVSFINRVDMPSNLGIVRETEQSPRQSNLIVGSGGFEFMKPVLDMTPKHRKYQTKEEIRNSIEAEDRELSSNMFNE